MVGGSMRTAMTRTPGMGLLSQDLGHMTVVMHKEFGCNADVLLPS